MQANAPAAPLAAPLSTPLLEIRGLKTHFATDDGIVQAVDGVDITIRRGETLGVVGESGCGKTVTAMSVLKLIAMPPGRIAAGQILYQGRDLVPLNSAEMDRIRAAVVSAQQASATNAKLIPIARQQLDSAQAALNLSQANLRAGTMLTIDVLQSQAAADQARLRYVDAVVHYNQAQVDLVTSLGLTPEAPVASSQPARGSKEP